MKKITTLLSLFILLTAFTCENEPLEGEFGATCETAETNSDSAREAFNNATEDNYTELCNAYKAALLAEIEACGDANGDLQTIITNLGDCSVDDFDTCDAATTAVGIASANFDNATISDYTELCNAFKTALENQITECGDTDGSLQTTIDDLGDCMPGSGDTSVGCGGTVMLDVFGQPESCDYSSYNSLQINNVYIGTLSYYDDVDNDGVDDHTVNNIYVTDGTATLDADNNFVSFEDRTYMLTLSLRSLGTDGLQLGLFKSFGHPGFDHETSSYLSLASSFSGIDNGCDVATTFICSDTIILDGVVTLNDNQGAYDLCFDTFVNFEECFNGTYSGNFIPVNDE